MDKIEDTLKNELINSFTEKVENLLNKKMNEDLQNIMLDNFFKKNILLQELFLLTSLTNHYDDIFNRI